MAEPAASVVPLPPAARFVLRLAAADAAALGTVAGLRIDGPINRCCADGGRIAARLGPDEWLLLGPEDEAGAIEAAVAAALAGRFHALVDVGHRDVAIAVAGAKARAVLNAGCPLDLDDAAFPPGAATRTLLGKAGIVLLRPGGEAAWRVECARSFAPYVAGLLAEAAREFAAR